MIAILIAISLIISIVTPAFNSTRKPGMYGKHFEGDIVLMERQKNLIKYAIKTRNGLVDAVTRWPDQTVVYEIKKNHFDDEDILVIKIAMAVIALRSCIKFRPRRGKEYALVIKSSGVGCYSNVGYLKSYQKNRKHQDMNLGEGCVTHQAVVHEMLHTLGFFHMQSTYNRNDYVKVIWSNIYPGEEHNFERYNRDTITDFGVPYDYESIMHYDNTAFSKNGKKTIVSLEKNVRIRQSSTLTDSDIEKLNRMYCYNTNYKTEDKSDDTMTPLICKWPLKIFFHKNCQNLGSNT